MEKFLLFVGLLALAGTALYMHHAHQPTQIGGIAPEVVDAYQKWKIANNKKYSTADQEWYRLTVFADNYEYIREFYEGPEQTYSLGFTQFMDITNEEFVNTYLGTFQAEPSNPVIIRNKNAESVDWRQKGVLNEVKNQGGCGSCWAFSTVGSLEPLVALESGSIPNYSEQQLVDCSKSYGNYGCNGGLMTFGFDYIKDHGVMNQSEYPYKGVDGQCRAQDNKTRVSGYTEINDCASLKSALNNQPVSVAVDASRWSFYSGGVFNNCSNRLNHGIVAVGYDENGNWIIRNSWGTKWGENGYIRLAAGDTCGVCDMAVFPTL